MGRDYTTGAASATPRRQRAAAAAAASRLRKNPNFDVGS